MAAVLAGCGRTGDSPGDIGPPATPSSGQVAAPAPTARVDFYAASRLAEQASFGPTPALVATIQARGMAGWIDDQMALPPSQIDLTPFLVDPVPNTDWDDTIAAFPDLALKGADQIRLRLTWVLSQLIVTDAESGDNLGRLTFANLLMARSLGTFEQLLIEVSTHPLIGELYDLRANRPTTEGCASCALNHRYARTLLDQFTLGPVELGSDGQPVRDALGRPRAAYTARDVQALTRALTGWWFRSPSSGSSRLPRDWGNWREPMVASTWPGDRDFGSKQLLGVTLPAHQLGADELRQVVGVLAAHPNTGRRLARHLIQGLVKSQPSAAYLQRVVAVYDDNGQGVRGDLKAMVRAVLLDPEARAADAPLLARPDDGRLREDFLVSTALYRVFGCQRVPRWDGGGVRLLQVPFYPPTLRGFHDDTERATVSHQNLPGHRWLNAELFNIRAGVASWLYDYQFNPPRDAAARAAGCSLDDAVARYQRSPAEFQAWMGDRFFRGVLPPGLRQNLDRLIQLRPWNVSLPGEAPVRLLSYALISPYFGVIE